MSKEQPDGELLQTIKNFAADPEVHDAVYNPTDPFSVAWHRREEKHRRALEAAKSLEREIVQVDEDKLAAKIVRFILRRTSCEMADSEGLEIIEIIRPYLRTTEPEQFDGDYKDKKKKGEAA